MWCACSRWRERRGWQDRGAVATKAGSSTPDYCYIRAPPQCRYAVRSIGSTAVPGVYYNLALSGRPDPAHSGEPTQRPGDLLCSQIVANLASLLPVHPHLSRLPPQRHSRARSDGTILYTPVLVCGILRVQPGPGVRRSHRRAGLCASLELGGRRAILFGYRSDCAFTRQGAMHPAVHCRGAGVAGDPASSIAHNAT